ncbi:site-specific integrase [Ralstonia mannitolilytica]|nr:site-specific integrase [Ralstonia mannitolilytica]
MENYAEWLANFLEWVDLRGVDVSTCDYNTHILGRYQKEMLEGLWSRTGKGLSPATVNARVLQACDYLLWLADSGKRVAFQVPYTETTIRFGSAFSSIGHRGKKVRVRKGKVRAAIKALRMPTDADLHDWLKRVRDKFGETLALMCESILRTAVRRQELVCLRLDTLPKRRQDWDISNPQAPPAEQQVRIKLKFGTKGPSYGTDHGDKIGPDRDILIPLTLALKWDEYRRTARNRAFAKWMEGVKGATRVDHAKESVHLFLREGDGIRFTGPDFYSAWVGVERPIAGWSPHKGRHWWACSVLWRELKKHKDPALLSNETAAALIESMALSIIRLQIQPQLGHATDATTMIYLRWVMGMLGLPVSLADEDEDSADAEGG